MARPWIKNRALDQRVVDFLWPYEAPDDLRIVAYALLRAGFGHISEVPRRRGEIRRIPEIGVVKTEQILAFFKRNDVNADAPRVRQEWVAQQTRHWREAD